MQRFAEHYLKYLKEEEGYDTITTPYGFASYSIDGDELYFGILYVDENARGTGKGQELGKKVEEIGREMGCKYMTCNIFRNQYNGDALPSKINSFSKFGFKVSNIVPNCITMIKEL